MVTVLDLYQKIKQRIVEKVYTESTMFFIDLVIRKVSSSVKRNDNSNLH